MRPTLEPAECQIICAVNRRRSDADAKIIQARCDWLKDLSKQLDIALTEQVVDLDTFPRREILTALNNNDTHVPAQRRRLLIAGAYLEDVVSIVALEALLVCFDPCLVGDLIQIRDKGLAQFAWQRLIQAGAVPTTMAHVLLEWSYA